MSKVTSALGGALAGIKKPEPRDEASSVPPVVQHPAQPPEMEAPPIGVVVRFNPRDHETVSEYALQLGMSLQELVETAINEKRVRQGLAPIQGRPRSKTRRRR